MMRVRLKADGRIVEILPDGSEKTIDHSDPAQFVRHVRARCGLTQAAFAEKIEVPIETVRNWEQGKRHPRGPARALLKADRPGARRRVRSTGWKTALKSPSSPEMLPIVTRRRQGAALAASSAQSASADTSRSV